MTDCPACWARRLHAPEDWAHHHPYAGHGYQSGQGWSHPDLPGAVSLGGGDAAPAAEGSTNAGLE